MAQTCFIWHRSQETGGRGDMVNKHAICRLANIAPFSWFWPRPLVAWTSFSKVQSLGFWQEAVRESTGENSKYPPLSPPHPFLLLHPSHIRQQMSLSAKGARLRFLEANENVCVKECFCSSSVDHHTCFINDNRWSAILELTDRHISLELRYIYIISSAV